MSAFIDAVVASDDDSCFLQLCGHASDPKTLRALLTGAWAGPCKRGLDKPQTLIRTPLPAASVLSA